MRINKVMVAIGTLVVGIAVGYWLAGNNGNSRAIDTAAQRKPLYWVEPMDPSYRRDEPGIGPMGMALVPVYEEPAALGDVKISAAVENNLGVRTARAILTRLPIDLTTVGYIQFDEKTLTHIHTRVEGWIEQLNIGATGDAVTAGQVLFEFYGPDLVNAQEEYLSALASNNRTLIDASRQRLHLLGMQKPQLEQLQRTRSVQTRIAISAAESGVISALNVREGMYVNPDMDIMSIGTLDRVWAIAEVFSRQSSWVKPGQSVLMTTDSYPGEEWRGEVDYIYPVLDAQFRTVRVRVTFNNQDQRLKPNMLANLTILAGDETLRLAVPRSAIIRGGHGDRVVKRFSDGSYQSVGVLVGIETAAGTEILRGLVPDDEVVVSAQFLIDSESNIDSDLGRISGGHGHHAPPPNANGDESNSPKPAKQPQHQH